MTSMPSPPATGHDPVGATPIDLAALLDQASPGRLARMAAAGEAVMALNRAFAKSGTNPVRRLIGDVGEIEPLKHYPERDIIDPDSGAQVYYHAHDIDAPGFEGDHGHIHCFLRGFALDPDAQALEAGTGPALGGSAPAGSGGRAPDVAHLVAISFDRMGAPSRLFTANRWVTNETVYPASALLPALRRFRVEVVEPCYAANLWLGHVIALFRPQVEVLLTARDAWLEQARAAGRSYADVLEDRSIEILSWCDISLEAQMRAVRTAQAAQAPSA